MQPHEYERAGTAKLLTLFHPATGLLCGPWRPLSDQCHLASTLSKEQLWELLAEIEKQYPATELPSKAACPVCARWETWLGHPPRNPSLPALRIVLV